MFKEVRSNKQVDYYSVMPSAKNRRRSRAPAAKPSTLLEPSRQVRLILLLAAIALFAAIRFRLREMPLERDEGEYAYAGQLMLQGIPPYKLIYNIKLPGTYAAYSLIMVFFGQTPSGIHLGLMLVNAATSIMMFFLAKRLFGGLAGTIACATYALLSTGAEILGLQAHATHFVVFAAVAGLLVLFLSKESPVLLFWSGILLGVSFVMKQPGLFFVLFALLLLAKTEWERKSSFTFALQRTAVFILGAALPFTITCLILALYGVFGRFWFWVFDYARAYGSQTSIGEGINAFRSTASAIVRPILGILMLALVGVTVFLWDLRVRKHAFFCLGLLVSSVLAVCPGLYFRRHYFILILPAIALLTALAVSSCTQLFLANPRSKPWAFIPCMAFGVAFCYALVAQADILFEMDPVSVCRSLYEREVFPEAVQVGEYIKSNSPPTSRLAVLGSQPEIYFYSQRHSVTGYMYTYPFWEDQPYAEQMQGEMISEIEAAHPEFLILDTSNWTEVHQRGFRERLAWFERYVQNYTLVARLTAQRIDASGSSSARGPALYVFRRNQGAIGDPRSGY